MTCKNCLVNGVWEFTNKTKLCKTCFIDYFERKVWGTIRKYNLLPKDKIILLKKDNLLNTNVLKFVFEKKFTVKSVKSHENMSSLSLSDVSEKIFESILSGNFKNNKLTAGKLKAPLYFHSDKEVELYSKLVGIKGKKIKRNEKIQVLFEKFKKNPDLEHNIINAFMQIE